MLPISVRAFLCGAPSDENRFFAANARCPGKIFGEFPLFYAFITIICGFFYKVVIK